MNTEPIIDEIQLKRCQRCEESLPLSEFGVNKAKPDGLMVKCKGCCRETDSIYRNQLQANGIRRSNDAAIAGAPAAKALAQLKPSGRIVLALGSVGRPLTFKELRRATRMETDDLSAALPLVLGRGLPVGSRNGTGPGKYFLNPDYQPPKSEAEKREIARERAAEPPLSFSTLNLPTTPILKGTRR